jgi:hypothetical protein
LSLTAIVGLEMPFINAISKVDLLKTFGKPEMNLQFYNTVSGMNYLFFEEDDKNSFSKKFGDLSRSLCNVIEKYGLVGYSFIDIHNKMCMGNIIM